MKHQSRSPANIRIENRQARNRKTWRSQEWKHNKAEFLKNNPVCAICGKPAQTPHHPDPSVYGTPAYYTLAGCIPLCHRCHAQHHEGKVLCKVCKDHFHEPEFDCCLYCANPEDVEHRKYRKESRIRHRKKALVHHPCERRAKYQGCDNGGTCNYSWRRARECAGFMGREATAA